MLAQEGSLSAAAASDELDEADQVGGDREEQEDVDERLQARPRASQCKGTEAERRELDELHCGDERRSAVEGRRAEDECAEHDGGRERAPRLPLDPAPGEDGDRRHRERRKGRSPGTTVTTVPPSVMSTPGWSRARTRQNASVRASSANRGDRSWGHNAMCRSAITWPLR